MYTTSQTWNNLMAVDHKFNVRVNINGTIYAQSQIIELSITNRMFAGDQPSVGGCIAAEMTLKMLAPSATIPRMALIRPWVQVTDGTTTSEWIPQGKFYIDTRETTHNDDGVPVITFHAYDAMLMTEAYYPDTSHSWPYSDILTVREIASAIGVALDARTTALMTNAYSISTPAGYTMREVLSNIAAMYAGNFMMNYDGNLLLVAINGIPEETSLITDEDGNIITFGGDAISIVSI